MEGYLNKAPSFFGQWRRRYFTVALQGDGQLMVRYFTGPDCKEEKGSFKLDPREASVAMDVPDGVVPYGFSVSIPSRRYVFGAENVEDRKRWMAFLSDPKLREQQ
eukprot:m.174707 g.174707  ORF g.174707 m.174707 type:complete len:105 (-) comp17331_c2_seq8:491-805(-)